MAAGVQKQLLTTVGEKLLESYDDSEAERVKNEQLVNQFFDGIHTKSMELVVPRCFNNVLHCYKSYNTLKLHLTDDSKEL